MIQQFSILILFKRWTSINDGGTNKEVPSPGTDQPHLSALSAGVGQPP
jgi:hypothetical protein